MIEEPPRILDASALVELFHGNPKLLTMLTDADLGITAATTFLWWSSSRAGLPPYGEIGVDLGNVFPRRGRGRAEDIPRLTGSGPEFRR
ncbi:hypothetical protein [Actinoplanes sp. HUAS TT8]|uniref:hypothetical protein n=1 Tax=Actinoplanes sp. HUAS TT8 TaxID=3447453 RepID=UPI003F522256